MANQQNYVTDIQTTATTYDKFTVSRIVDNPLNSLVEVELPPSIPTNQPFEVEISLYSIYDNALVFYDKIPNSDAIILQRYVYNNDGSIRTLLFFDFAAVDLALPDGRFQAVFSFLVPVIGNSDVSPLMITNISPSRTELQLQLIPQYRTPTSASYLRDYMSPQITKIWVIDALRQIFNQPASSTSDNIPTDKTTGSYAVVETFFPTSLKNLINDGNTNGQFTASIKTTTKLILDTAYGYASESVRTAPENTIYTLNRLTTLVSASTEASVRTVATSVGNARYNIV